MLKFLGGAFLGVGGVSLSLMLLYSIWTVLRRSFLEFLNPWRDLLAILQLMTVPLFWIMLVIFFIGIFIYQKGEELEDKKRREQKNL